MDSKQARPDDERDESGPYDDVGEVTTLLAELEGVPLVRSSLIQGPGGYHAEALVDAADYDRVTLGPAWSLQRTNYGKPRFYVVRGRGELLHRVVMADELAAWTGPSRAFFDHVNGDRLDNRRCNLRVITQRENRANRRKRSSPTSSRFKGVSLQKGDRWVTQISRQGWVTHLGAFDSEEDAARAYSAAARIEYGEYACVNFAREGEQCALSPQPDDEPNA